MGCLVAASDIECRLHRLVYDPTHAMLPKFLVRRKSSNRTLGCQNFRIGLAIESKHFVAPPRHWETAILGAARKLLRGTINLRHKPCGPFRAFLTPHAQWRLSSRVHPTGPIQKDRLPQTEFWQVLHVSSNVSPKCKALGVCILHCFPFHVRETSCHISCFFGISLVAS